MPRVLHTIEPVYDASSRILILGTMPSPKSREQGFYYGHPQNRFWQVLAAVLDEPKPETIGQKKRLLLARRIALWDVLRECEIQGAADGSIRKPLPNDFSRIFAAADIRQVFTTGAAATRLYARLTGAASVQLPSTSPANCRLGLPQLVERYRVLLEYLA